jgi:hypothetical protein
MLPEIFVTKSSTVSGLVQGPAENPDDFEVTIK